MKHLFVVTYGRSGSTVLLNLLNAVDGYCIRGENLSLLKHLSVAVSQTRKVVEEYTPYAPGPDHPWYGIDRADTDGLARALAEAFERFVLLPPDGARVVGFKEIRYNPEFLSEEQFDEVIDFIMTAFDEPRIVFNLRSWKELANSGWWAEWPRRKVRREIETCDARFRRAHARYPDRTFMIDHAQYDGKPEGLRHLLDWLGETVDDTVMQEVSERRLGHLDKLREVGEAKKFWKRLVNSVRG